MNSRLNLRFGHVEHLKKHRVSLDGIHCPHCAISLRYNVPFYNVPSCRTGFLQHTFLRDWLFTTYLLEGQVFTTYLLEGLDFYNVPS